MPLVCADFDNKMMINVLDILLTWHFEQAVLCNVRGVGEPVLDPDFPPGTDMMGEIFSGPQAGTEDGV